ncbi:MAG: trigger factor [Bacteroidota bacterium]|nr:trigger factor [Bacteroidota bacterium]
MKVTKDQIDDLNAVITVNVEKTDYQDKVNDVLKDYRKKANVDGFRPGKAPMGLVKKMYGKAILMDEVNNLISEGLTDYMKNEDLQILGEPMPNEDQHSIDFDKEDDFSFKFDIGMSSPIEVNMTKREKLPYYKIKADETLIDEYIESYAKNFGEMTDAEVSDEESFIIAKVMQLDAENKPMEDGIVNEEAKLSVALAKDDDAKAALIGLKADDIITLNLWNAFPNEVEVAGLLKIEKEEVEALEDVNFQITVHEIQSFSEAEIDQKLWDKVFKEGEVTNMETFREKIAAQAEGGFGDQSETKLLIDAKEKLISKVDPKLPEDFLKRWVKANNREITEEQIENEWNLFLNDMKWQIISNQLAKENEIKVDDDEMLEGAKAFASAQFQQYGMGQVPDEYLENYASEILKKEEETRRIADQVMEKKLLKIIRESMKVEEKEVSWEEFKELFEDKN